MSDQALHKKAMRHHEKARLVSDEFKEILGYQPPYPRSTIRLKELELEIADAKKQEKPVKSEQEKPVTNDEFEFLQQRFVIEPYLKGYQMNVPDKYSADPKVFLENAQLYI